MWEGPSSDASTAALGLPLRKGSISTLASPSVISKHACPKNRMSTSLSCLVVLVDLQYPGQLPTDGHAHEHPDAGLLGEEGLDARGSLGLVGGGQGLAQLA